jgi:hypothetical protein
MHRGVGFSDDGVEMDMDFGRWRGTFWVRCERIGYMGVEFTFKSRRNINMPRNSVMIMALKQAAFAKKKPSWKFVGATA